MEVVKMLDGYKKITVTDKTDYFPGIANNGGAYIWYDRFERTGESTWLHSRDTSGEFCPYCHSFDCSGCEDPEVIGVEGVMDYLDYAEQAGFEIDFEE